MRSRIRTALSLLAVAVAMTFLFWWPLYGGAGFIGGDLYPYFFPQKAFYADCLKAGAFPLWNDLAGFGYPVLGESQTGAAYPFHLVLYICLDLNTAYNAEHLLHYLICFIATWLFASRVGLTSTGAYLTAIVFTYGWFPTRACLEWAILTGAWLPVALLCVESFLQTRQWRYAIGLSVALGLQLLAGHFHLAFITQLLVVTYFAFRLWGGEHSRSVRATVNDAQRGNRRTTVGLVLAVLAGACLASVQLLPTWELKQRSSRVVTRGDYDPAYGHMPPLYVTQLIAPWAWYSALAIDEDNVVRNVAECLAPWHWFGPIRDANDVSQFYNLDRAIQQSRFAAVRTGTNKVEAHLYCGLVPVCLAIWGIVVWFRCRRTRPGKDLPESVMDQTTSYWLIAGLFALVYATGLLLPIGRHLPGFRYFRGPGRYGIVTTFAIALFAGRMLGQLSSRLSTRSIRVLLLSLVFGSTCGDLWLVSRMVKDTVMVSPPRIAFREASEVRRRLLAESRPPRLLAPGANVGNLLGVSCVPWYLGIAPAEYVESQFAMPPIPQPLPNNRPTPGSPELLEWLSRSGVTHVLNFEPLDPASWQVELVWKGVDPFLNRVWGRKEPIHLYRFRPGRNSGESFPFPGRAYVTEGTDQVVPLDWKAVPAEKRRYHLESGKDGQSDETEKTLLIVTELAYPGWTARRGDELLAAKAFGMFRAVEPFDDNGDIVWTYRPHSVYYGAIISLATLIALASVAHVRFWHPQLVDRIVRKLFREAVSTTQY